MKKAFLLLASLFGIVSLAGQTHTIKIHEDGRVASLLMTPTEYSDWKTKNEFKKDETVSENLFKDIYKKFTDDFDFIFLVLNESEKPANLAFGRLWKISNATTGLKLDLYDNSFFYGSSGKLQSIIQLSQLDFLTSGPSLHELFHNWGNYGIPTRTVPFGNNVASEEKDFKTHWGFTGGSSRGQLGGFDQNTLIDNGSNSYTVNSFGTFANGGNNIPYNELELYLMGLIPISEVSDFNTFSGISSFTDNDNGTFNFTASKKKTYTPESLEALLGPREPKNTSSQKNFKSLVIVLTDTPLTTAEWNLINTDAEKFSRNSSDGTESYNFWEATNGLATLEMDNLQGAILSVDEPSFNQKNIAIYPNPTNKTLTIDLNNSDISVDTVLLINSLGVTVTNLKISNNKMALNIDLSNYSPGHYSLQIKNKSGVLITKKIVVY